MTERLKNGSVAKAWVRALELTDPIARNPTRIFASVMEERAAQLPEAPALLSDRESLTYGALVERSNRYARWALKQALDKGDCVCLLMPNRPEYLAIWLGITSVGCVAALLNTNLVGPSLAHCINVVAPRHIIVAAELLDTLMGALPQLAHPATVWIHGASSRSFPRIDVDIQQHSAERLNDSERRHVTVEDRALYIYTSGTTGLPKAANISHGRVMQWSHWFAGLMNTRPTDRMYDCLPMYHSVGGIQAPGAVLIGGGSVVIRERFSAREFWSDVVRWNCTLLQYIGELCRYLLQTDVSADETLHVIRMACGNGLRPDVWDEFKTRFRIPQILEFYGSTEGNVSLFNVEGESGSIGRIPPYLAHRFPVALVKFDVERNEPVRNELGFCICCAPNEPGEAIGRLQKNTANVGGRFEGYSDKNASSKKLLHNVFADADVWFRSGDLLRRDERGFLYFVDRIGDTFRWKGENVATSEVEEAICGFEGVKQAIVYGVNIPGSDGRAGMAAIVAEQELDLSALRVHLMSCLPEYARPLFLRIRGEIYVTSTFKYIKADLMREGYDPAEIRDRIYYDDQREQAFIRLDKTLYDRIQSSETHRRSVDQQAWPIEQPKSVLAVAGAE